MDIEREFGKYMKACYGSGPIPETQLREVRQAFLSGIVVALTSQNDLPTIGQLKSLLTENRSFPVYPDRN